MMASKNYRVFIELHPEDNPELGLPAPIKTKRGICIKGEYSKIDWDKMVEYEVQGGLRAIEHHLKRWQDGEVDV